MTPAIIDTHCHLTHGRFRGRVQSVLAAARDAGLVAIITAGTDVADSASAEVLARDHAGIFFTAGVHPHEAKDAGEDYLQHIEQLASAPRNVAVGEIGLDHHYDFSPPQVQRRVFAEQLALARQLGKPAVVHTREAFEETLAILANSGIPGERVVFHSFTGDAAQARRIMELGAYVGFSGIATFKRAEPIRRAAVLVQADRILIETDSPYLAPEPVRRQKTNTPANVVHVARCLAEVRGTSLEEFARQTTANAVRFFGLDIPA